jgi:tetratricopeptide (TPR) repeat protein
LEDLSKETQKIANGPNSKEMIKLDQFNLILKAGILKKIGDHTKAIDTLSTAISKYPDQKDVYLIRGQYYLLSKQAQKALLDFTEFNEKCSLNNQTARAIGKEALGDAYKKLRLYKQAQSAYEQAAELLKKGVKNAKMDYF